MTKLTCNASNCVNNVNGFCSARNIHISSADPMGNGNTKCDTFGEKGFKNAFKNLGNVNMAGTIKQLINKDDVEMTPNITCSAVKCIYNESQMCTAGNINVNIERWSNTESTRCESFKSKE